MKRCFELQLAAVALLLAVRLGHAQATPPKIIPDRPQQWKEYVYPNDGFALTLPEKPNPRKDAQMAGATAYQVQVPNAGIVLHVENVPEGCAGKFSEYVKLLGRSVEQGKKGPPPNSNSGRRIDVSSVREMDIAGHPAAEYEEVKASVRFYERWQCVDKRLYVFDATWPIGISKPADVTRVVNSFRLVAK